MGELMITYTEARDILDSVGITQAEFARRINRRPGNANKWLCGRLGIPENVEMQLRILKETGDVNKLEKLESMDRGQKERGLKRMKYERAILIYNDLMKTRNMEATARNFHLQGNQVNWAMRNLMRFYSYPAIPLKFAAMGRQDKSSYLPKRYKEKVIK
jgi:hypothetical protein